MAFFDFRLSQFNGKDPVTYSILGDAVVVTSIVLKWSRRVELVD